MGFTWPAAFALGAIVSPPDAIAATAITQRLRVPKRLETILEGESMVNDATALVVLNFAIVAAKTGTFSLVAATGSFFVVSIGGIAVGLLAGWAVAKIRPWLADESVEAAISLLTPYLAYIPAERLHVSGVLAAVTTGIYMSRKIPQLGTSRSRLRLYNIWEMFVFILNSLAFILIGLQIPTILKSLAYYPPRTLSLYTTAVCAAAVVVRLVWVFAATYSARVVFPKQFQKQAPTWQEVFLVGWTGMRGIVSLAAAMALPLTIQNNEKFPGRELIIFITFGVILFTLVFQGLTLPFVIRVLGLKSTGAEEEREEAIARLESAHAALARLEVLGFTNEGHREMISRVRVSYEERVRQITRKVGEMGEEYKSLIVESSHEVQREALAAERRMLVKLRDDGVIGDDILRRLQEDIDLEEAKLTG